MAKRFGKQADRERGSERANEGWVDEELAGCEFREVSAGLRKNP
jgi:hypothetical protein